MWEEVTAQPRLDDRQDGAAWAKAGLEGNEGGVLGDLGLGRCGWEARDPDEASGPAGWAVGPGQPWPPLRVCV